MYKKITALLCLIFSIVLFGVTVFAAETADTNVIYVSGAAANGGTGSVSAPVSTLAEAYELLGNNGTIYLLDTVTVSATKGDCFIAPTHTGKITVTSAPNHSGALDLTGIQHVHFGGETEWNDLEIIANDVVLSADNHVLTMGEGLVMSSPSDETLYRGGHEYCAARVHLAAYAVCNTAGVSCTTAAGELYVHSGEYWSVSAWYGGAITVTDGRAELHLGTQEDADSLWVRYLCPGLFGASVGQALTSTNAAVSVFAEEGLNTAEPFRFTQNSFSGSMTVYWLLSASVQGDATALAPQDCYPANGATCALHVYANSSDAEMQQYVAALMRGSDNVYSGSHDGDSFANYCAVAGHMYVEQENGWLVCSRCSEKKCRHRTSEYIILQESNCQEAGEKRLICTDVCGAYIQDAEVIPIAEDIHTGIKTTYDPDNNWMGLRCVDCNTLITRIDGKPETDVYVAANSGTPISGKNISEHFNNQLGPIGCRAEYPFANFEDAMRYAAMAAKLNGHATLHILDEAYVPSGYITPVFDGTITITGGALHFDGTEKFFRMAGDVTFENITFMSTNYSDEDFTIIAARNHKLVMGEGIVMGNAATVPTEGDFPDCNSVKMMVVGGFNGTSDYEMATDITIRSGDYWYIGGWNYNASTNDGTSKITIGKTNDADKLQVFYLSPFSRGDGYITKPAEGTIVVDGDLYVKRFTVTTLNDATTNIYYALNVVLKGNIIGSNEEDPLLSFDVYGCPLPYPLTLVNVFTDARVATAVEDSYVFLGHPDGTYTRDASLDRLGAVVHAYSYADYCISALGGHTDSDSDLLCDVCGHAVCAHENTEYVVTIVPTCREKGFKNEVCTDCGCVVALNTVMEKDYTNHDDMAVYAAYDAEQDCIVYKCAACDGIAAASASAHKDVYVASVGLAALAADNLPSAEVGGSAEQPFGDFELALQYAAASADVNGSVTLHLVDPMIFDKSIVTPSHSGTVIICGNEMRFTSDAPRIYLNGDTTFADIDFYSSSAGVMLFAQNHKLVMGEGIRMCNADTVSHGDWTCNGVKMYVYGGFAGATTETTMNTNIMIRSGDYWCVGGWNYHTATTVSGNSNITVGKTNAEDDLYIVNLIPHSTGVCNISSAVSATITVDGDVNVKLFYVNTQNDTVTTKRFTTNVVLCGDLCPDRTYTANGFDICSSSVKPLTTLNVYVDERVEAAVSDGKVFTNKLDTTLTNISASVNSYTYVYYCKNKLGGHIDSDGDSLCDRCGNSMSS